MSKIEQNSFDLDRIAGMFGDSGPGKWRLRRSDGLYKESNDIKWLEFNEDGTFKEDHVHDFAVGRSLLMSPFNAFFTWQTTPITAFEVTEVGVEFVTENSNYVLEQIEETTNTNDNGNEQI